MLEEGLIVNKEFLARSIKHARNFCLKFLPAVFVLIIVAGCCGPHRIEGSKVSTQPVVATLPSTLPEMANPRIVVEKTACRLTLYDGQKLVKVYNACTGRAIGDKEREGDKKTPEGDFFVVYKNPQSKFTLSLGLSYPNLEDAKRGLDSKIITQAQYDSLLRANEEIVKLPPGRQVQSNWEELWKTPLGGEIMIHGAGAGRDGTAGCVGMDDDDIRELYPSIPLGTPVSIKP